MDTTQTTTTATTQPPANETQLANAARMGAALAVAVLRGDVATARILARRMQLDGQVGREGVETYERITR